MLLGGNFFAYRGACVHMCGSIFATVAGHAYFEARGGLGACPWHLGTKCRAFALCIVIGFSEVLMELAAMLIAAAVAVHHV